MHFSETEVKQLHAQDITASADVHVHVPLENSAPETGFLLQNWQTGPHGHIGINSRYLTRDGLPWMPIMGEFHYSRFPQSEWAASLAKMKAGGIQIVASYVFWNHHEDVQGEFDWQGNKSLRAYVQAVADAGLLFCLRVGPWVHGEARYGGFPDWLMESVPASARRSNAPAYMKHVSRLYAEIGDQVRGLMWNDGGPIVAVQLENEYDRVGPECGAEHIIELKRLAIASGLMVPLYTVTGWPTLDIPAQEVVPVSGAYADGFWQGSTDPLPPSGVFVFDTERTIGEMGNVGGTPAEGLIDPQHYPFFLAEAGGGMHQSYHRRPVISTEDVYATALTQIGSGANLYGYYMYHGGTNPVGSRGYLNETVDTGYPNDVPQLGYDFHAPLGQYGQIRPSWGKLALLHHFVAAYGPQLAPLPAVLPQGASRDAHDRKLRVCVRADVEGGFVFINNHVRHHPRPTFENTRIHVQIGDETVAFPPVTFADGVATIWPVLQRLGAARLRYATVQPLTRLSQEAVPCHVYVAMDGIPAELAFEAASVQRIDAPAEWQQRDGTLLRVLPQVGDAPVDMLVTDTNGRPHRIILLNESQGRGCTPTQLRGRTRLVLSEAGSWADGDVIHVAAAAGAMTAIDVFPADGIYVADRGFARFSCLQPGAASVAVTPRLIQQATPQPLRFGPHISWRPGPMPQAPDDAIFSQHAAHWTLAVPDAADATAVCRWLLRISYAGDAARLYANDVLIDDQFFDGATWEIALDRHIAEGQWPRLRLEVLPAHKEAPMFLEDAARKVLANAGVPAALISAELVPVYDLTFDLGGVAV
ncbi:beta-galactosidase [Silvimonas amylolytica]|uniref:Beta-galactosidase n=1 Tax=Silvimonas amylolytica TaxID=449663 RepID=A0ABQ2PQW1_9NEIS|nr:beta-galactosidase [Silvimonas amylolytica]GGP27979.1 hypothetical protein GCM10010971_37980 [Silvimonas amylolytica]